MDFEQIANQNKSFLHEILSRKDIIAKLLVVEVRFDGSWYVSTANCHISDQLGLGQIASEYALERFRKFLKEGYNVEK